MCLCLYPVQYSGYVCEYFVPVLALCVCVNRVPLAGYMCISLSVPLTPSWTAAYRDNESPL